MDGLQKKLELTIAPLNGIVGIGLMDLDTKETLTINNGHNYPMQSVYKFPLAIYILHLVDQGKLSLDQPVHIRKEQMSADTWSPLADEYPGQDIDITIGELLKYTVSKSDNNGCDILFGLAGGPRIVGNYIHSLGIKDMDIVATEAEMHASWNAQYINRCQPSAMLRLLQLFYKGKLLSKESTGYLLKLMTESDNSDTRIKGWLPKTAVVAHKTGTSGSSKHGLIAATNDVGIITLPDGRRIALVVYVSDYTGGYEMGEQMIASVAKCIWDHYFYK